LWDITVPHAVNPTEGFPYGDSGTEDGPEEQGRGLRGKSISGHEEEALTLARTFTRLAAKGEK
jgi:hypothetical protein